MGIITSIIIALLSIITDQNIKQIIITDPNSTITNSAIITDPNNGRGN